MGDGTHEFCGQVRPCLEYNWMNKVCVAKRYTLLPLMAVQ